MPRAAHQQLSFLHLEDSALDAELTAEALAEAGVDCAITRIVRLEKFEELLEDYPNRWTFDMVLADFKLPGYDGLAALRLLRRVDPHMPFVLLSGALGEELAVELLRNGATDYVLKHNLQRLPLVVRRAVAEHQSRLRDLASQQEIRKARDAAEKANSAKGRFLGRISHELRTPLNAILGYTQLIQADPLSEEQSHCADQILKAGEHLLQLINEVLDITRIESGVFSVNMGPTSLTAAIQRATDLIKPMARENGITIHTDSGPCDIFADGDSDRLAQVLINLLTNAIKYNRPRGDVYVECQGTVDGMAKILVRDTGIGISPDKLERLFTPFDRLDMERETKIQGTGLGLTVAKALVEAMDGTLTVSSTEGRGTTFCITLPRSELYQDDGIETSNETDEGKTPEDTASTVCCTVLLVEDHEASRDFLKRVFARRGKIRISTAGSINDAIDQLQTLRPDVVVTDLNFAGRSGEDLLVHMKSDPHLKDIPVIVTTIDNDPAREQIVRDLGAVEYFSKPLDIIPFLDAISRHGCPGGDC